jgi:hypothetical protein
MGYERQKLQMLGGGFNMLPPGDKVPVTDYLLAQNFRTDALGRLVSRAGYPQVFQQTGIAIAHSAAAMGAGGPYYVAGNTTADLTGVGWLYYNGQPIASGFDAHRVGFAAQNGFMWVMNRGKQGRHTPGSQFETWTLTPPPASPTAAATGLPLTSGNATYTYNRVGDPTYIHYLSINGTSYQFAEDGYGAAQIPLLLSILAKNDPNATVQYDGTSQNLVITPIAPNTLVTVTGSDGNPAKNLANGAITALPTGTYVFYLTYQSFDSTLESNPSPPSNPVTVNGQAILVTFPTAPAPGDQPQDGRVNFINIYVIGGTMQSAYRAGQVVATNTGWTTSFVYAQDDASVIENGVVMPTDNDLPPAAAGVIGPHFSRLYAWSTALNRNRLFWTNPGEPQYWPGANDPQIGNWVDVGLDDEDILWCSIHANLIILYKQRSVWMLIGSDPSTATLEQVYDGLGLVNQWALAPAGQVDYFVAPNGLCLFDMSQVHEISGNVQPLFNTSIVNSGPLTPPGNILAGPSVIAGSISSYAVSLGHALGRLFISYGENGSTGVKYVTLVFDEGPEPERQAYLQPRSGRWFYERQSIAGLNGFYGFFFDGTQMIGLTGGTIATGLGLADFRGFLTEDVTTVPIECVYGSHYEDCGQPDNDKQWLEVVIDYEYVAGTPADVYAAFNTGKIAPLKLGTLATGARQSASFSPGALTGGADGAFLARNMAVFIDAMTTGKLTIHNVYLFFYVEARVALIASTIPTDLGVGKIKQAKELELDIDTSASAGNAIATIVSDLPGNQLAIRQTINVQTPGRAIMKYPFAVQEGLLWQVLLGGPPRFRLYSARLLMRVLGTSVEAYEGAAGFVWDSMEQNLGDPIAVKRAREISLKIDFNGALTVNLLTDLPGNAQTVRFTTTINSSQSGARVFMIPLPQGANNSVEGRIYRLKLSASVRFTLYGAAIDARAVGIYVEAYEATGGAVWDSTAIDFGDADTKTFDELRFEMETDAGATATATLYTDLPGEAAAVRGTYTLATGTTGRAWITAPLPANIEGRSARVLISSGTGFRLYTAEARWFRVGRYLCATTPSGNDAFTTLAFDFESERIKMYKRLEVDIWADNTVSITVITDQGGTLQTVYNPQATTNGRQTVLITFPPGVRGRLLRVSVASAANGPYAARIYHIRAWSRPLTEPEGGWKWEVYPLEASDVLPAWHRFPVAETPAVWTWTPVLSVEPTPDTWEWVPVDLSVSG